MTWLPTGCRWGEAQVLTPERIARDFANTKSKRVKAVPVAWSLRAHWAKHGPFTNCKGVFRVVLHKASIKPPCGHATSCATCCVRYALSVDAENGFRPY